MAQLIADKGQQVSDDVNGQWVSLPTASGRPGNPAPVLAGLDSETVSNAVTWAMFTTDGRRVRRQ